MTEQQQLASNNFTAQLRRHSVALISLAIALFSLGYNTWRNETTEHQRNLRHASFEMVEKLGELQSLVNAMAYDKPESNAWVQGWGLIMTLESLATLMPEPVGQETLALKAVWASHIDVLAAGGEPAQSVDRDHISPAIKKTNETVLATLASLD